MSNATHAPVGHADDHDDVTLYVRNGIRVTRRWLVVDSRRYPIKELKNLRTVHGDRRSVGLPAILAAGVVLVAVVAASPLFDVGTWTAVAAGLVLPMAVIVIAVANSPKACELWADYRGLTVRLLWLDDREHYNQICRAITRARERIGS